ncbi:NAD(P)/FAD-dependent oxidoreductase [Ferroplasma sp.]|uniref:NAD(P)/FAD-dependent oxidoreductase n=1 Tax=Ferroplasma sp. TaxID=2591003 RepID=UPI00307D08F1
MIKIAGLGISGIYLYHRLRNSGFDVSGYDPQKDNYYNPCGYATNEFKMSEYMSKINIDFKDYILSRAESITFSGNNFTGKTLTPNGLCTFDKNKLETDSRKGIKRQIIAQKNGDIIIDATGISRSYLGQNNADIQYKTLEYLTEESNFPDFYFYFLPRGRGYFWSFPLGNKFHIGIGSRTTEDFYMVRKYKKIKVASRNIRMAPLFNPVWKGNIIGVGEAIGTVSPLTGEGILPSIKSAEILFDCISKYGTQNLGEIYEEKIGKEFGYYAKLASMVSNIQKGNIVKIENIRSIKYAKKTINEFGIQFNILPFIRHFVK